MTSGPSCRLTCPCKSSQKLSSSKLDLRNHNFLRRVRPKTTPTFWVLVRVSNIFTWHYNWLILLFRSFLLIFSWCVLVFFRRPQTKPEVSGHPHVAPMTRTASAACARERTSCLSPEKPEMRDGSAAGDVQLDFRVCFTFFVLWFWAPFYVLCSMVVASYCRLLALDLMVFALRDWLVAVGFLVNDLVWW